MEVLTQGVTHVLRSDILELLIGLAVLVTLLVLAGLIFQAIGSARDARRFPPPGRLVNIGGHRLHIYCMGEGTPAVVMDSGFPASSLSWTFVQPAVARFTHACSYDRAGLGWSDAGPMPRSSRQIVEELHPEKTRLIEFGRFAAQNREKRGEGKPETFTFLGFTHYCGKRRSNGSFIVWRKTAKKRMVAKLHAI
jgi:hypothetical protein